LTVSTWRAVNRPPVRTHSHSLDCGLQLLTIIASKCIPNVAQIRPPNALKYGLQVYLQHCLIAASKCISNRRPFWPPYSLNHHLQVRLKPCSIMPSKFTLSWPPSLSPSLLNHDLGVHLSVHLITLSKCICKDARLLPSGASSNLLDHCLSVCF
jgi:hypothetical protein